MNSTSNECERLPALLAYCVVLLSGTLLMTGCSYRLWLPSSAFPRVPLVPLFDVPSWIEIALAVVAVGCMMTSFMCAIRLLSQRTAVSRSNHQCGRASIWMARAMQLSSVLFACLFTLNQHRLQPWAYHYAIAAWTVAACGPSARRWLAYLLVSVYVYSALGKIDVTFSQTVGRSMVQAVGGLLGLNWSDAWASRAAWSLPIGELLVGTLLLVPRTRRLGVILSLMMHVGLVLVLGPLGLNHHWPVLVWNVSCAFQVLVLFEWWLASPRSKTSESRLAGVTPFRFGWLPVLVALVMPITESWEVWDSWPSWGLYSKRFARAELWVGRSSLDALPKELSQHFDPNRSPESQWVICQMDRWSFDSLGVPVYPNRRFHLGVALAVAEQIPASDRRFVVVEHSVPDRLSGETEQRTLNSIDAAKQRAARFFWNAFPVPVEQFVD